MSEDRRQESALEDFLQRRSSLSKAYRDASGERPPAALDEAILAASRRAVGAGPRRLGWTRRWGAPLAAAAVLVLAVAVVFNLQDEPEIARFKEAEAPAAMPAPELGRAQLEPRDRDAAQPAQPMVELPAREAAKHSAASGAFKPRSSLPAKAVVEPRPAPAASEPPGRATSERADQRPAAAGEPAAPSAAFGVETREEAKSSVSRRTTAGDAMTSAAVPEHSAATPLPPAALLEQIEALYARDRQGEGDRALREFCRSFPGYRLPDSLNRHALRLGLECAVRE